MPTGASMVDIVKLLLRDDESCAYQPDDEGSYPIHLAAALGGLGGLSAVNSMVQSCPDSASLRDGKGRTFLHVAVDNGCVPLVALAAHSPGLLHVMNMQDKNGNTALHRAVLLHHGLAFFFLLMDRRVQLQVKNHKGQTPLDLARLHNSLKGNLYPVNSQHSMYWSLINTGVPYGDNPCDIVKEQRIQQRDRRRLSVIYKESAQNFTIGAVLIVTVTFAATFTMPGGYVAADDDRVDKRGTPTLAGTYFFDMFVVANAMSFFFSGVATFSLMYAGFMPINFAFRESCLLLSQHLLLASVRCVGAAFVVGIYVMLASVAMKVVVAVFLASVMGIIYINFEVLVIAGTTLALLIRGNNLAAAKTGLLTVFWAILLNWPLSVIAILPAILKGH